MHFHNMDRRNGIIKSSFLRRAASLMCVAAAGALTVAAQENLKQEITVTHREDVKPTDAVKLNLSPAVTMPPLQLQKLDYSMRQVKAEVPATLSVLSPASYADSIYRSPFRGYVAAGYFPMLNAGASAGYKFIDNDRVRVNGWLQYDGVNYRGNAADFAAREDAGKMRVRRNTLTLGGALHSAVGKLSYLDLGIDYTFARYNTPSLNDWEYQNVHRINLLGLWSMNAGKWNTGVGAGFGHFAYTNAVTYLEMPDAAIPASAEALAPTRENRFHVNAFASASIWGAEKVGLDVKFAGLNYGNHAEIVSDGTTFRLDPRGSLSHALLTIRPYYRVTWKQVDLNLGVNLNLTFNNGKAFHFSPAAQATWKPGGCVNVYIKANGGEHQNTLGSLYDASVYTAPNLAYGNSHLPFDGEVGVTVGLFKGFYSVLSAGYAIANDWLMPVALWDHVSAFEKINMKGHKLHFSVGYRYRNLVDVNVAGEMAPQKYDKGYYLWRDRAKYVAEAALKVTPVEPLSLGLSWRYRGSRRQVDLEGRTHNLGNVSNIDFSAGYSFTQQLTVFAKVENLFNHHYMLVGGVPANGVNGLIGLTYKF